MTRASLIIVAFLVLLQLLSCDKGLLGTKFRWVENGSRFYYDYYTPGDTVRDARMLTVYGWFDESDPSNPNYVVHYFRLTEQDLEVKKDGLHALELERCGGMGITQPTKKFSYLYAPEDPGLNEQIQEYGCERTPQYTNMVIEVNKTISVPAGNFKTYVIKHSSGDLSYWDPDHGIIMYDRYDLNGNFIGSLKLNRVER